MFSGVQLAPNSITICISIWSWGWTGVPKCSTPSSRSYRPSLRNLQGIKLSIVLFTQITLIFKCFSLALTEHGDESCHKFAYQSPSVCAVQRPELLS